MKCPKCHYLGFETGDRCRNCGYDFSLLARSAPPAGDLPLHDRDWRDDDAGGAAFDQDLALHAGPGQPLPAVAAAPAHVDAGPVRAPAPPPVTPAPISPESAPDIAGTWTVYQNLVAKGVGPASLDELIRGAAAPAANGEAVDIRTLLYKGERARQRAQELREAARRASGDDLRAIIDEVCDLVVLAIEPE